MQTNECQYLPLVAAVLNFGFDGPAPLFPCLDIHPKVLTTSIFDKLSIITSVHVSRPSDIMSFYDFVIYCLYSIIYLCQPCQPISQHHIHVRACARGNFVYRFLTLYFGFVKNRADRADTLNTSADLWADRMADGWLTWADAAQFDKLAVKVSGSFRWVAVYG